MIKDFLIYKKGKNYSRSTSGNATVEFALIFPILVLIAIPTIDFGIVVYNTLQLRTAMNVGVSSAMQVSSLASAIQTNVENATSMNNVTLSVTKSCQCSDNTTITCTEKCTGGINPDTYFDVNASTTVDLYGTYGFVQNPYPISQEARIMVP